MTSRVADEVTARKGRPKKSKARVNFRGDFAEAANDLLVISTSIRFPSLRYQADPVAFAREIIGQEPWSKQVEILEAVRDHPRVAIRSGHKVGKLLHNDTPVPTPSGWVRHGDLRVGSVVFDERGGQCSVTAVMPWIRRRLMRVTFEDGTYIDADEKHEWVVHTRESRKRGGRSSTLETSALARSLFVPNGKDAKGRPRAIQNFTIDLAQAVNTAHADLPIDPYLLGVWLGDGTTSAPSVTSPDPEIREAFHKAGFETVTYGEKRGCETFAVGTRQSGSPFRAALVNAGLFGDKHVPQEYLWASAEQRLALLQGLMDTDGFASARGLAEFTNTNERLARAVLHLARSLGIKARIHKREAKLNGRVIGPVWDVNWNSPVPVFRIKRKLERLKTELANKRNAHKRIAIVNVEPIAGMFDAQCIEVDSPSHLYLAGESMVPTHNSNSAALLALWYFSSHTDARVVMSSTTARQVDQILWRELRMMVARGGRCVDCKLKDPNGDTIPTPCPHSGLVDANAQLGDLARTGLKSRDFREIVGFTAREAEAVAGISGGNLLYLLDEASGIPQVIFDAIEGNRAGGAKLCMYSNPTKNEGEFYDAFHSKKNLYHTITVSSAETPNVVADRVLIPGLATRAWIEEKKEEWGEKSPLYQIRVEGVHAQYEEGKIFSVHTIEEAEQRWYDAADAGRLFVGLDPAGSTGTGDETCFATRRGLKVIRLEMHRGLDEAGHLTLLLALLARERLPRETPVVVMDRDGEVGNKVMIALRAHVDANPGSFELVAVRASDKSTRMPHVYDRQRDALTANLEAWIRDGGAIPEDAKLSAEMHKFEWKQWTNGKLKCTPKDIIRKDLGRSPDRYDAVALSVWEPLSLNEGLPPSAQKVAKREDTPRPLLDPYAAQDAWKRR